MKNHSVLNLNRLLPLVRDNVEYQPTDLSDPRQFYHSCYQKPYILLVHVIGATKVENYVFLIFAIKLSLCTGQKQAFYQMIKKLF